MTLSLPEPPIPTDAELLSAFAANRSPEAFRHLVDRHLPAVHAAASHMLRAMRPLLSHHVDDIVQSVFILLARDAAKIPADTPLIGWLYKVAYHACGNLQRTETRRQRHEQETANMAPASTTPATVSDAEALLDPALLSLSSHDRNALLLRYTHDLSVEEIAHLTHVPAETAKKRLHRALQKLRHYFAARGMLSAAPLALHALAPSPSAAFKSMASTIASAALAPATATAVSVTLAKGVIAMKAWTKIKIATGIVMMAVLVGGTAIMIADWASTPTTALDPRQEQQAAVDEIQRLGGEVYYDYQRITNQRRLNVFDPKAVPRDTEAFHPVISVSLRETQVVADDLKILAKFLHLEILDLTSTQITSAGLAHLESLKELRVLSLWKTQVDDEGLKHIEGLTRMWQLNLDDTQVTDAGLVYLKGMTELEEWLGLAGTQVTDDGVTYLEGFKKLRKTCA